MTTMRWMGGLAAAALSGAAIFVYGGFFDVAADRPHSQAFLSLVDTVRERSIARRARELSPPALSTPEMITAGGPDYEEMCAGCHLKPGVANTEIRAALYPQPPDLTRVKRDDPAQTFWIIKHGIKMSAMPAWGQSHDDHRIWAMVAFLQQLPRMTPEQYQVLTARDEGVDEPAPRTAVAGTPEAAVDAFFRDLMSGDAQAAQAWLASDVLIYESGHAEHSREQYLHEHLPEDIKALSRIRVTPLERSGATAGDMAWVASRVRMQSSSPKQGSGTVSTETMVLRHEANGWRIQHIHWSSSAH